MTRAALRVLEFYSGIGGMHYALQRACPGSVVLDAFDVNHAANTVYQHNFAQQPRQVDLVTITSVDLDAYAADLWLLAPPCQPFTRQGKQLGGADARSSSFLHLLQQLQHMQQQPQGLLVENVVGFQGSDVHTQLAAALDSCGYHIQEFVLTPSQYGVPYSRPRYFCVASKQPLPVPLPGLQQPCMCTPAMLMHLQQQGAAGAQLLAAAHTPLASHIQHTPTLGEYLSLPSAPNSSQQQQQQQEQQQQQQQQNEEQQQQQNEEQQQQQHQGGKSSLQHTAEARQQQHQQQPGSDHLQQTPNGLGPSTTAAGASGCMQQITWVSDKVLQLHADCIDVVSRASRSCNCFTKAYGHFARGTGSLLATVAEPSDVDSRWQLVGGSGSLKLRGYTPPSQRVGAKTYCSNGSAAAEEEGSSGSHSSSGNGAAVASEAVTSSGTGCCEERQSLVAAWKQLGLRFFTVCEIAKLHSFPDSFSLPAGFSSRQGYQLLGNSLSVAVVADLLTYLTHSIGGC